MVCVLQSSWLACLSAAFDVACCSQASICTCVSEEVAADLGSPDVACI